MSLTHASSAMQQLLNSALSEMFVLALMLAELATGGDGVVSAPQVSPDRFTDIKSALVSICSSSTRSSKPAIYGIAAEAEIKLLRPLASIEVYFEPTILLNPSTSRYHHHDLRELSGHHR